MSTSIETIEITVEIWTEQDRFGMWSYDFVFNGKSYSDHDYQSRGNAIEVAKSVFRSEFTKLTK